LDREIDVIGFEVRLAAPQYFDEFGFGHGHRRTRDTGRVTTCESASRSSAWPGTRSGPCDETGLLALVQLLAQQGTQLGGAGSGVGGLVDLGQGLGQLGLVL